ncbi:MAG: PD-(D/E)XK nuclease family protein [Spirochaetia bacterium]|nr:PD-(D/E)XK nuclease family protein [Spirochaetia bacterium]
MSPSDREPTDQLGSIIASALGDARVRFVFPSEVAARDRLERALDQSGRQALPLARFLSWDAFKSLAFPGPPEGIPSSAAVRLVFARAMLADNARAPFLSALVPREHAARSPGFAGLVARALPALAALPDGQSPMLADWKQIRHRYAEFLAAKGLFEPGWNPRAAVDPPGSFIVFYPELTTDWPEYESAVRGMARVRVVDSDPGGGDPVPAARFPTLVDELRSVLRTIMDELSAGADPASVMISVAGPDGVLPVLEREAAVAGLRLDVREAKPLSDSSGGRLLADLAALASSGFSFHAARRLLLDASRPWQDPAAARALVDLGIRKHILATLPGTDVWEASMGTKDARERSFYRSLRSAAGKVASAKTFAQLRSAFDSFRTAFLDEESWSPAQNDEIARCVRELEGLDEAARLAGLDPGPGVVNAFLDYLADIRYLPVSSGGGVAVYRYPVCAGALPDLHFAVNLSQDAAASSYRPLSFLRDDERERAGARDRDLSDGLVRLLARSGKRVFLSCSEDGPDGVRPAHQALRPLSPGDLGFKTGFGSWPLDSDALPGHTVELALPIQATSAVAALVTVFPGPGSDYAQASEHEPASLPRDAAARVIAALADDQGRPRLSDTLIEELSACPFRRLFKRWLGAEPVATGLSFIDALMTGQLYHDTLARLLEPLRDHSMTIVAGQEAGETARPSEADLAASLETVVRDLGRDAGVVAAALVSAVGPALLRDLVRALDDLRTLLDGMVPVLVEGSPPDAPLPGLDAVLAGRLDLMAGPPGTDPLAPAGQPVVIVDFKKNKLPTAAELHPEDGGPAKLQMPAYDFLATEAGYAPDSGWYLSIEGRARKDSALCAFGPAAKAPPDHRDQRRQDLLDACSRVLAILSGGLVYVPDARDREALCSGCTLRPVCRVHYTVR